jgi:hypothetical protein
MVTFVMKLSSSGLVGASFSANFTFSIEVFHGSDEKTCQRRPK